MTTRLTHKLGLTIRDGNEMADQVASLGNNYDLIDSKAPYRKQGYQIADDGVGPPGHVLEQNDPAAPANGFALTSMDTGGTWQVLNLPNFAEDKVKVGDWLELTISGLWNNSPSAAHLAAVTARLVGPDLRSINPFGSSFAVVNQTTGDGIPSCRCENSKYTPIRAKLLRQVTADDLITDAGVPDVTADNVWVMLLVKTVGGYKFIFTVPHIPFRMSLCNLGQ